MAPAPGDVGPTQVERLGAARRRPSARRRAATAQPRGSGSGLGRARSVGEEGRAPTDDVARTTSTAAGAATPGPATRAPSRKRAQYTSRRRASATVTSPGAAPSASSEHTPNTGTSQASPSVRAVTSPTRSPVKGAGPVPTTTASTPPGTRPRRARPGSSLTARRGRAGYTPTRAATRRRVASGTATDTADEVSIARVMASSLRLRASAPASRAPSW